MLPVACRDLFGGRGNVPQRQIQVPAENEAAGHRNDEHHPAGDEESVFNGVKKLLRRAPGLEQDQAMLESASWSGASGKLP
jgi:hypothetical protein